jgi:hypothetical protein
MTYEVTLESKDKHLYNIKIDCIDEKKAEEVALNRIQELGWDCYIYKVIKTKLINITKENKGR